MLLIIHNLPASTRYTDVKSMIKEKCGLTEIIVDNLAAEGKNKKVTVGLADEGDAAILVRNINGLFVQSNQLYVEDVRQNKINEQPYWPAATQIHQNEQNQYNQQPPSYNESAPVEFDNQFYSQEDTMHQGGYQAQSNAPLPGPPPPNFGVPFYMSAPQKQNIGNKLQYMVEYPKLQGHMGNVPHEGHEIGFDKQYGRGQGDRSRSPGRGRNVERSARPFLTSNDPAKDGSYIRRDRDRSREYDNRHDTDRSYREKSNGNPFHNSSNQEYGSSRRSRMDDSSNRPAPKWDRPYSSTFGDSKDPSQGRRHNQDREPPRFREDYSQSRDSGYLSRPSNFPKKRPLESSVRDKVGPKNKTNKPYNTRNEHGTTVRPFPNNFQNKKSTQFNRSSERPSESEQSRSYGQPKGSHGEPFRAQMQPAGFQNNKPQWQQQRPDFSKNQRLNKNKKEMYSKNSNAPAESKKRNFFSEREIYKKNETIRHQTASIIISQIAKKIGIVLPKRSTIVTKLKECVLARLGVVMGNDLTMTVKEMIKMYRKKFQDDGAFYNAVLNKVNSGKVEDNDAQKKDFAKEGVEDKQSDGPQSADKPPVKVDAPVGKLNDDITIKPQTPGTAKLPKYPEGNKKMLQQMKQAQKKEMMDESMYTLDAEHEKALCEELDKFDELIRNELENPEEGTEKSISKFMKDDFLPDLRKILTLHTKKRVLDIKTNLSVRINCQPKSPKRHILDAFLKDYGVISLKPSDRDRSVLIAVCDSYESFDALCKEASAVLDTMKITFKPLHLTGPPVKGNAKKKPAGSVTSVKPDIKRTEYDPQEEDNDDLITEENSKQNKIQSEDLTQGNYDSECEIIPSEKSEHVLVIEDTVQQTKDVIIIDENDDKSTVDDEGVIVLDEGVPDNLDSKPVTEDDNETIPDAQSITTGSEEVTVTDDNDTTVTNDIGTAEHEDLEEVIENDNIEDDDLEDF